MMMMMMLMIRSHWLKPPRIRLFVLPFASSPSCSSAMGSQDDRSFVRGVKDRQQWRKRRSPLAEPSWGKMRGHQLGE
eukprot:5970929-Karenia_brevis.AAC.1